MRRVLLVLLALLVLPVLGCPPPGSGPNSPASGMGLGGSDAGP